MDFVQLVVVVAVGIYPEDRKRIPEAAEVSTEDTEVPPEDILRRRS